ncbi:MAG: hypothetical protein HRU15_07410, partial [Planctomycetes bacterium]|nr:hypothetical protein [Planctomycetota bacterium]
MILGLRASEANRIQELCLGDKRLLMRIGALLQQQVSFSEAVLEEIKHSPEIRKFIMDREINEKIDEKILTEILEKHACNDIGIMLSEDQELDDQKNKWLYIHFDDELNNPFLEETTNEVVEPKNSNQWMRSVSDLLPTLNSSVRTPLEGLLAAKGDEQRAAAIEQLR